MRGDGGSTGRRRPHPARAPVAIAVVSVLALLSLLGYAEQSTQRTVQREVQEQVRSNRDAAVRALVRETGRTKRTAVDVAARPKVAEALAAAPPRADGALREALRDLTQANLESPVALVADPTGRVVATYPESPGTVGRDFSFRDWFRGVSGTDAPYVSSAYRSAAAGRPVVVAIAAPVRRGTRLVGYLVTTWQLTSVKAVAAGAAQDDGVAVTITDQRGQPLTGDLRVDARGEPLAVQPDAVTRQALAGGQVNRRLGDVLVSARRIDGLGWTVRATRPSGTALASAREFRRNLALLAALGSLVIAALGALATIVAVRRARERRYDEEEHLRLLALFAASPVGILEAQPDGQLLAANAAALDLLGYSDQELRRMNARELAAPESVADVASAIGEVAVELAECVADVTSSFRGEVAVEHADGALLCMILALTWLDEDSTHVLLGQLEDITARRAAESRLTDLALHDELTGLPNRRLLLDRCQAAFAVAADERHAHTARVGALFLDLDGFKPVNDTGGHELGDRVLVDIARSLRSAVRPTDTVSRVGGDEFVVLIPEAVDAAELRELAERVRRAVHRELRVAGRTREVSASVGVAIADVVAEPHVTPEQLLRWADAAMYHAKGRGKNRHEVYDAALQASTEGRLELETAVRDGLRDDRLEVVFQPIVDVDTGRLVGAESLLRLRDAGGRLLPTLAAVRAAEAMGAIGAVTDRVLARALQTARLWPDDVTVAVNISPRELQASSLRERIERALRDCDVPAARLVLEITESSIVGAGEASLRDLDELRRAGVRVAIDDFGTAYATLANLTTLPVDILKVDATFTAGLPRQQTHSAIVHGLASMAREMGIPCVVEGVETLVQYDALRGLGVHAQGWLWGEPTPEREELRLRSIPLPRAAGR